VLKKSRGIKVAIAQRAAGRYDRAVLAGFENMRCRPGPVPRTALLALATVVAATLGHDRPAFAQAGGPLPPPPKPYGAVTVTLPRPSADASFEAFRKELAAVVSRQSRADLLKLVVPKDFFWEHDLGGSFDAAKSSADNFTRAFYFDRDGDTWQRLAAIAAERGVSRHASRKGVVCAPGEPAYSDAALEKLYAATGTHGLDWAYPRAAATPVRLAPQASAAVVDTLKLHFVRTLDPDPADNGWTPVVTPSGRTGFVAPGGLATLYIERLCYGKDGRGRWRIMGYIGGGD
jgi:hypothetical protein